MNEALHLLARTAGIEVDWEDAASQPRTVADRSLRAVLDAIGFPAETEEQIAASLDLARAEAAGAARPLITADQHRPVAVAGSPGPYRLVLESGLIVDGMALHDDDAGVTLPAIHEAGYHRLHFNDAETIIAVAPARGYTLEDAQGQGPKLWGLAVQLYSLRRAGDGGIGDFAALAEFVSAAGAQGADAVAISPVHAQFHADVTRFGPYAPSNRAALNVLHIAQGSSPDVDDPLVNWPDAGLRKQAALRQAFDQFHDHEALAAFRLASGPGLERHAIFEALAASLVQGNGDALDFRNWPEAYQNPDNPAVARFAEDHAREVSYHAYLQYRADEGLRDAQAAAKAAGMRIGLIADLAVGTDHAGSHSWSRQLEVLRGLEIGAPPDLISRAGQSWGITAFSPRGLRNSGFSAFIDMLRHALRHAGGVRIDHVMGLARLWVIPAGFGAREGAYLKMPARDLMRLVVLESQRHRAVILGEDLGTLPHGFKDMLDAAGIAGLRVMWFERERLAFNPPSGWTRTAVAMTSTHDLPTVAGWWTSNDIAWRERLGLAGDDETMRTEERRELWDALTASDATDAPMPPTADGAAATYPAIRHLGSAACTLALLPVEDLLSLPEQPNVPGTMDEHPNWRRRLPGDAAALFGRADVVARLAALHEARRQA